MPGDMLLNVVYFSMHPMIGFVVAVDDEHVTVLWSTW